MPKVRWGISASQIDDFDRSKQFAPYTGPTPPNGVYEWKIKVLKFVAGTRESHPQLRIGLELVPREDNKAERKFKGYFVLNFRTIAPDSRNEFTYVPFLDAIGVSGRDFTERTIADEEGNIKKIGSWRNDGSEIIMGQLADSKEYEGKTRKEVTWMGPLTEVDEDDDDDDYDDEDSYDDEEISDEDYDDDEEPF